MARLSIVFCKVAAELKVTVMTETFKSDRVNSQKLTVLDVGSKFRVQSSKPAPERGCRTGRGKSKGSWLEVAL